MKDSHWTVYASTFATTTGVAFVLCVIFDALFPPFGLLHVLAHASPWAAMGSAVGLATGLPLLVVAGFVLGAIYGVAWRFWNRQLTRE